MSETQEQNDASSHVEVTRTIDAPVAKVWETLISPAGAEALVGHGALFGNKGESWHSEEGHRGVVRSFHPLEQLRVSWHETDDAPMSMLEFDLSSSEGTTSMFLRHDRVSGDLDADKDQWNQALERFEKVVVG